MGDSWEDIADSEPAAKPVTAQKKSVLQSSGLNPNAPSFSFTPSATSSKGPSIAPPQGFTMPTYPPPSGGRVHDSPSTKPSETAAPSGKQEPTSTNGDTRSQNDARTAEPAEPAKPDALAEKVADLRVGQSEKANGTAESASKANHKEINSSPPSAPDEGGESEEDTREQEAAIERINEELSKEDAREHMNVVFIGHVDAGKSTTGGQILYLTGNVDERTIQKYEKEAKEKNRESWYMAYIMDTNEEERAKGKTVEVGRAHFATEKKRFTILDAPGHKNYVPAMIAGATQADVGVLVISARKGEFETGFERGGQTREHAQLAKTLGVTRLIVAINKMDDPSVVESDKSWSKSRYDEIVTGLTPFLRSCGYQPKKDIVFLPMSGLLGYNLKDPLPKGVAPWYTGGSLFQVLDDTAPLSRDPLGPFRLSVIDKYKDMGTIAMGKSEAGVIRKGDNLLVMPNKQSVTVSAIYRDDVEVNAATGGENLRLRLSGIEEDELQAGFIICSKNAPVPCVTYFRAQLQLLDTGENKIFTAGRKAVLHIHSLVEECEIKRLISIIDVKTRTEKKKNFAKSGEMVTVRIDVEKPICIELFSRVPQLGRFTLRDEGRTIAIGKVVKLPSQKDEA